jgi:hypothetical protein
VHSEQVFRHALNLLDSGLNARQASDQTGVPWGTVRYWQAGHRSRAPRRHPVGEWNGPCANPEACPWLPVADEAAFSYLLAIYLGDGTIQQAKNSLQLRIFLDDRYPQIQDSCAQAIAAITGTRVSRTRRPGCTVIGSYSRHWACLFPQHGRGRKHLRNVQLVDWQQEIADRFPVEIVRGLIHSDGCRSRNVVKGKDYPRYELRNQSGDIHQIFQRAIASLGLRYTTRGGPTGSVTAIARRSDVEVLDRLIGPKKLRADTANHGRAAALKERWMRV